MILPASALAQVGQAGQNGPTARARQAAAAPRIAERFGLPPLAELGDATIEAPAKLEALRVWNEARRLPEHNGFERQLKASRRVDLTADLAAAPVVERAGGLAVQTAFDRVAWGGMVRVANAYRLRLHLSDVRLPAGARLWLHGAGETAGPFGAELIAGDHGLWTPSVGGDEAAVDVELPAAALAAGSGFGFTIDKVDELVKLGAVDTAANEDAALGCNLDASCFTSSDFPAIANVRHAIAMIEFVDSGESGQCTGQLLKDSVNSHTPYMLTANHCISTAAGANTLDSFWDYYTPSCNGPAPSLGSLPRSFGASLLATGGANDNASDYTLMRLNSIPSGRTFLGWNPDPNAAAAGTLLFRISHPMGLPQDFVITRSDSTVQACTGVPRPQFLYSDQVKGGTFGGSSGSADMLANGDVVAQLYGGCGNDNDCSPLQFTVDGAFSQSFPALQPFLQPGSGGGGACRPDSFTLCLASKRFKVQVSWTNQFNGSSGGGFAIPTTDSTGFFYFTDRSNYELIVKILDLGGVFKVFYGELTNLHFTITVVDTHTGRTKTYSNTAGDCGAIDESAFPAGAPGPPGGTGAAAGALASGVPGAGLGPGGAAPPPPPRPP
ncbi:MAG TPA: hypothetical protein VE075_09940, partial [Thermoanaerobaculia bacterium]|nr:hypothetical protein [Thermoanaerobaculia bacterium]